MCVCASGRRSSGKPTVRKVDTDADRTQTQLRDEARSQTQRDRDARDKAEHKRRRKRAQRNSKRLFTPLPLLHHLLDAVIAWAVGIVTGMQDILYNSDDPTCRVADIVVADAVTCACSDTGVYVVRARRSERVSALWCTGVLFLPRDDGKLAYVYNPYSLQELAELLEPHMNAYLECISSSSNNACVMPRVQPFDVAGVSPFSVLTRCRENYAQRQWDAGQHALFDPTFAPSSDFGPRPFATVRAEALAWARSVADARFFACVTTNRATEFSECLDFYLASFVDAEWNSETAVGTRRETYFAYSSEQVLAPGNPDACMLFTGPAQTASTNATRARFQQCVEGGGAAGECTLPALAWCVCVYVYVCMCVRVSLSLSRTFSCFCSNVPCGC